MHAHIESVDRVEHLETAELVARYVAHGKPVIVTGLARRWQAVSRWADLDYWVRTVGDREVPVLVGEEFTRKAEAAQTRKRMRMREYIALLARPEPDPAMHYLADVALAHLPELVADVGSPPYFRNSPEELVTTSRVLFLGRDTYTPPHHHAECLTMVCQIAGQKRMKLFSPDQSNLLYPPSLWQWLRHGANPMAGQVDIDRPDLERFPRFRHAAPVECVLEPGDMLILPVHWWHAVYSPGISSAVTFNYVQRDLRLWHFPSPGLLSLGVALYTRVGRRVERIAGALRARGRGLEAR